MIAKIASILTGDLLDTVSGLFRDYQEKKITKEQLKFELETFEERNSHTIQLAQIGLNKEEAKHESAFVAGWRPFLGWVCGLGFAMNFLVAPIGTFICSLSGYPDIIFPQAELDTMLPVLFGILGLGGYRTFEKTQGIKKNT
jgi:hypothetical protein